MKQNIILILTLSLLTFGSLFAYEVDVRNFTPVEICDEERESDRTSDNNEDMKFIFSALNYYTYRYVSFGIEAFVCKTPTHFHLLKPPRDSPLFS